MRHKYSATSFLFEAFERTKNINYLHESIHTSRQLLAHRPSKFMRIDITLGLLTSLHTRSGISPGHRMQDLQEMVELFPQYLNDGSGWLSLLGRFDFACIWAVLAQATQHPSISAAYEIALSFMQDIAAFSPTLQLHHAEAQSTQSTIPRTLLLP